MTVSCLSFSCPASLSSLPCDSKTAFSASQGGKILRNNSATIVRALTSRSSGWSNEYRATKLAQFIRGWVNYFAMSDMKQLLLEVDEWLRRKIRAIYWKQWKKVKSRYRMIAKFGIPKWKFTKWRNAANGSGEPRSC